jgi:glucose/mannose-6-phosphate isomerase
MQVLDDQNYIRQYDAGDALGFAKSQPEQLAHDYGLGQTAFAGPVDNVVFAGMGGSPLAAEFTKTWPELKVPFVICKDYNIPAFVGEHTLVICSSFSGNTEETLSVLDQAEKLTKHIAIIASGGKLLERAQAAGYVYAQVPPSPQPRMAVFYMYRAAVELLVGAGLVPASTISELEAVVQPLKDALTAWLASVPTEHNQAKQLAGDMVGKTPIIYAGTLMYPAAYKWKIDANENAKNTAWCNTLPEFNHNEFIGWSSHPIEKPFAVIDLRSSFEHSRTQRRFEVTDRMLSGMRPQATAVDAVGSSVLEQLLYLVLLGDFATIYLAILNGVNPTPVDLVEKFKKELG